MSIKSIFSSRTFLKTILCGAAAASLCLVGCGQGGGTGILASAAPTPTATPKPTPTPTPDPMLLMRQAQQIPTWAKSRVLNEVPVKPGNKVFALTFDDGPWPEYTREILGILAEHQVKATFFVVGQEVARRPEILKEVFKAGHAIGGHSWNHQARPRDPVGQIQKTDAIIKKVCGFTPTTFRPPYGILGNGMAKQARKEGQAVFIWSSDSNDWKRPSASRMASTVLSQASPGGIALMHDGGGDRTNTVAALPMIIEGLKERGYKLVTIPELLKMRYVAPPKPKKTASKKAAAKKS